MPLAAIFLSIAICTIFLIFAAVLAWADHSAGSERSEANPAKPVRGHAA
jgi:hypothetical protein